MSSVFKSDKPCALCGSRELTFQAKTPELAGVLCAKCLHDKVEEKKKPEKK